MQKSTSLGRNLFRNTFGRLNGPVFRRLHARAHPRGVATLATTAILLISAIANLGHPAQTIAATNNSINFQARLQTNTGAIVADGYYNVEFKLYSASSGGVAQWTEDYTYNNGSSSCTGAPLGSGDCRVQVINGYLTANLGSITSFPT